ncbi:MULTISPECIES: MaoC family dehydratase [unclassified Roseovarius]|uniref:MaoC family dehydratase n=1 Tax=unclassified Roseovarius TaxID=2614913 RepID=UPI0000685D73|nr:MULTISPECIES: MaoC family dehydratase [unclassified Roseovarius]EAQ26081.1 maoC protein [Roseovarius sp. 217]KJS41450.1 MAG: dehydratase [Roseovarius sp. BRH_c41]
MTLLYLEDFTPGRTFTTRSLTVTQDDIIAFATQFDPQPFHLDPEAATATFFHGLAASGWHTVALTMRLLIGSEMSPAGGIIGAGVDELSWLRPVRPGDTLRADSEILEARQSRSRSTQGLIKARVVTLNQNEDPVQRFVTNLVVQTRPLQPE